MKYRWIQVPVIEPVDPRRANIYEHTPVDFYRGEYPRFLRPVGAQQPRTEWKHIAVSEVAKHE